MTTSPSAVLFARDARRVARFYVEVFGATVRAEDDGHAALDLQGFRLVIHRIPEHLIGDIRNSPVRRESGAIRLDYAVADLVKAGISAKQLGGQIDDGPPAWASAGSRYRLGFDPEGNVFGVSDARS